MATTLSDAADRSENDAGLGALFRSRSVFAIVRYLTERQRGSVRVSALEQEIKRRWAISRGAVTNALQVLEAASLIRQTKMDGVLFCQIVSPRRWAKLGELLDTKDDTEPSPSGMPWLADIVANTPRRNGFAHHPDDSESSTSLEVVEAMLQMLPDAGLTSHARRSPAPGRKR